MKVGTLISFILSTILLLFFACSDSSWEVEEQHSIYEEPLRDSKNSDKKKEKCTICHYQEDKGTFKKKEISCNAKNAHTGHGDGEIGGPVPNQEGLIFGPGCELEAVVVECPCFTLDDLLSLDIQWSGYCEGELGCLIAAGRSYLVYQNITGNNCEVFGDEIADENLTTTPEEASACAQIIHDFIGLLDPTPDSNPTDKRCNL